MNEGERASKFTEVVTGGMLSVNQAANLLRLLAESSHVEGAICEFGCHMGRTAAMICLHSFKPIWLYDSFQGLPEPGDNDSREVVAGDLKAELEEVWQEFAGLPHPRVVVKWFKDVGPDDLPDRIAFAHIDGDLYESTLQALHLVYPRLSPGAAVVIDDYNWKKFPGVTLALDEFMADKPEKIVVPRQFDGCLGQQAYFVKV